MRLALSILLAAVAAVGLPAGASGMLPKDASKATVTTGSTTDVTETAATLKGNVKLGSGDSVAWFEYGPTDAYGTTTEVSPVSSSGSSATPIRAGVELLEPNTTYHYRLAASNSAGTSYGADATFTTLAPPAPDDPGTTTPPADPPVDPPVLGEDVVVRPATGAVLVRAPGKQDFVPLDAATSIPEGSTIDARAGTVRLTSVRDDSGELQTGAFRGAIFKVRQGSSGMTDLYLRGNELRSCGTHAYNARSSAKRRSLWGRDHGGRFRTHGHNSVATVRGTVWTVTDRCDKTVTRVARGKVAVRDKVRHRTVLVHAGERYVAKSR